MKFLSKMHLIQFSFWDFETFDFRRGGTAFVGPNGAGKTSLIDAVQIALIGAHGHFLQFNTQQSLHKDSRTVRDYALGSMRSGEAGSGVMSRKREEALSYITLVFEGARSQDVVSAGICIHSKASDRGHRTMGMYVLPGVRLELGSHLESTQPGYFSPIDWNVFEAGIRDMAKKAGREPTITVHPEAYLKELLHSIQGKGPSINHDVFLRALAQSLRLKGVRSVNDFIRENLVDAKPIDRQGTLRHIKTLQELSERIEEVKKQIGQLEDIESDYARLETLYRLRASAQVVRQQLEIESTDALLDQLGRQKKEGQERFSALKKTLADLQKEEELQQGLFKTLSAQIAADPASQKPEQVRQLREAHLSAMKTTRRAIDRRMLDIREALGALRAGFLPEDVSVVQVILATWDGMSARGEIPDAQRFAETLHWLGEQVLFAKARLEAAVAAEDVSRSKLSNLIGSTKAAGKGMRISNADDLGAAMEALREHGIESATVGSLVRVTDVRWQPAIESFLGRNRFALVVAEGLERDAVRIIRHLSKGVYDVTIVQSYHLRDSIGIVPDDFNVGSLLVGDHPVALAYLRRIIGRMRKVETEEELEKHDRSLTMDGMLSANGGTRRIRLVGEEDLVLGARVSEAEKARLHQELQEAIRSHERAEGVLTAAKKADARLRQVLYDSDIGTIRAELAEFTANETFFKSLPLPGEVVIPEQLRETMALRDLAERASCAANEKRVEKSKESGQVENELNALHGRIEVEKKRLDLLQQELDKLVSDANYDNDTSVRIYTEIADLMGGEGAEKALARLDGKYVNQESKISKLEMESGVNLRAFASGKMDIKDELADWRKAFAWVKSFKQRLVDSQLAEYQEQAKEARDAANDAFHHDVALKLREATHRIRQEIDDLNRILKICPEFTGRERYHFTATIAAEFRWLHDMIDKASYTESSSLHLFDSERDSGGKLAEFLQSCESGENKGGNPLEDNRLLFNFDLDIQVDGKTVDRLSKRLGVGSNGEHLIPFYVIAGATLVNAYRMKPGSLEHEGAALMIIDEAFHGFDAQNTYVTAQFLKSLGLQLVMAAPDSDVGKLIPAIDSYYDLWRHGIDVEADEIIIKEDARKLMISDIPDVNPDLVRQTVLDMQP